MSADLSLVIACYRDAPHLLRNVTHCHQLLSALDYSIEWIFVEDSGGDGTVEILESLRRDLIPDARIILHQKNQGRGATVRDGFGAATGKVRGFIDIDLAVSPVYIPEMMNEILERGADVAVAHRIYRTSFHPSSMIRDAMSYAYRYFVARRLGLPYRDTEAGYKFFRAEALEILLREAVHPGWFWDTELMYFAHRHAMRVAEVSCVYRRDKDKVSTVNICRDSFDYWKNLGTLARTGRSPAAR